MRRLETLVLDGAMVPSPESLRIVFTSIHGTGGVIIKPMLKRLGFKFPVVPSRTLRWTFSDGAIAESGKRSRADVSAIELAKKPKPICHRNGSDATEWVSRCAIVRAK